MVATSGCLRRKWFNNIRTNLHKLQSSTFLSQEWVRWRNTIKPSRHVAESNPCCQGKKNNKLDSSSSILLGCHLLALKQRRAKINRSVDVSPASSRWTAEVVIRVKSAPYRFVGPKYSTPKNKMMVKKQKAFRRVNYSLLMVYVYYLNV